MLENKKAAILADAQKRAAEVDKDMEELERLTGKYGLQVMQPNTNGADAVTTVLDGVAKTLADVANASVSVKAKAVAEAFIRQQGRPMQLGTLHEMLEHNGIRFFGPTPRNTLSAVLGQAPALYSISRSEGWWLSDVPVPPKRRM
jgi:hypothetical protein